MALLMTFLVNLSPSVAVLPATFQISDSSQIRFFGRIDRHTSEPPLVESLPKCPAAIAGGCFDPVVVGGKKERAVSTEGMSERPNPVLINLIEALQHVDRN